MKELNDLFSHKEKDVVLTDAFCWREKLLEKYGQGQNFVESLRRMHWDQYPRSLQLITACSTQQETWNSQVKKSSD